MTKKAEKETEEKKEVLSLSVVQEYEAKLMAIKEAIEDAVQSFPDLEIRLREEGMVLTLFQERMNEGLKNLMDAMTVYSTLYFIAKFYDAGGLDELTENAE